MHILNDKGQEIQSQQKKKSLFQKKKKSWKNIAGIHCSVSITK